MGRFMWKDRLSLWVQVRLFYGSVWSHHQLNQSVLAFGSPTLSSIVYRWKIQMDHRFFCTLSSYHSTYPTAKPLTHDKQHNRQQQQRKKTFHQSTRKYNINRNNTAKKRVQIPKTLGTLSREKQAPETNKKKTQEMKEMMTTFRARVNTKKTGNISSTGTKRVVDDSSSSRSKKWIWKLI